MTAVADHHVMASSKLRRLRLVWEQPETHRFVEVGQLTELADQGRYSFQYSPGIQDLGLVPLTEFPEFSATYVSEWLPAFFLNRVMSARRPSYYAYLSWLGLSGSTEPMEILARTGGGRATDDFHVLDTFDVQNGHRVGWFPASGIARIDGASGRVVDLRAGDELAIVDQVRDARNHRTMLLSAPDGAPVGYVPDWLVDEVDQMRQTGPVTIFVEQVNLDAPDHLKLLCRLEAPAD